MGVGPRVAFRIRDDEHEPDLSALARRARAVLDRNRRGDWTCPSGTIYPHQWLWDSSFVAIGLARDDPARGAAELRSLFRGQWSNGMLPHMVFADGVEDVGSERIWRFRENPLAPRDVATSCITQPPVPAIAAERVAAALPAPERSAFVAEVVPKLVAHHSWLYRERDPDGTGLVTLKLLRPDLRCVDYGTRFYCERAYFGDLSVEELMRTAGVEIVAFR